VSAKLRCVTVGAVALVSKMKIPQVRRCPQSIMALWSGQKVALAVAGRQLAYINLHDFGSFVALQKSVRLFFLSAPRLLHADYRKTEYRGGLIGQPGLVGWTSCTAMRSKHAKRSNSQRRPVSSKVIWNHKKRLCGALFFLVAYWTLPVSR